MNTAQVPADFDAVVVGAGFGGILMLHKLRNDLGLKVRLFEKADGVGGTWHWNRYPGAHSDSEAHVYCYSFDDELLQDWDFETRFVSQPRVLDYFQHVVERYNLADDIQLNTGVVAAHFDESRNIWEIGTDTGETYTARYFVPALGVLHAPIYPDIKDRELFQGVICHTSAWPEDLDLAGKRVGVVGTGSSGTQVITAIAPEVGHLTVFQRSPQYIVPIRNRPLAVDEKASIKANYKRIWDDAYSSLGAFGFREETALSAMSVSEEERERIFQRAWDYGNGLNFMLGTFNDIIVDPKANEAAASFIRRKIQEIVKDPETARILTPHEPFAKRPVGDAGYYETFNRENVTLVDAKAHPIAEFTTNGVRTQDGTEYELDVLVVATGYDGFVGSYSSMDICGRDGKALAEQWKDGGTSFLGVAVAGFPNLFTVFGPYSPFANNVPLISTEVEFIAGLIGYARDRGLATVETTQEAENSYVASCNEATEGTLLLSVDSWLTGGNVPGKPKRFMMNLCGLVGYRQKLAEVAGNDYTGFKFGLTTVSA